MKTVGMPTLFACILAALLAGGAAGFFVAVKSTQAGKALIETLVAEERAAETSRVNELNRERYRLQYPGNWKIDTSDKDHDPDHLFSIDSPGSAFAMFVLGKGETVPEETLQMQIAEFQKVMSNPVIQEVGQYGSYPGKGAVLKGRIMGIRTTIKVFSLCQDQTTVMITQQFADEDEPKVRAGFALIEKSFSLKPGTTAPGD